MSEERIYFPEIDCLRFFAFMAVFLHHFKTVDYSPFFKAHGWIGVELFLLISAFLITTLLAKEFESSRKISIRNYFFRRILRIWPLYFVYLLGMLGLAAYTGTSEPLRWLSLLTFTDNFATACEGFNPNLYTGHLWTISLEEQLYFVFPFVAPLLIKLSERYVTCYLVLSWLVLVGLRYLALQGQFEPPFIWVLPIHCDSVIAGILLAKIRASSHKGQSPLLFFGVFVLGLVIMSWMVGARVEGTEHLYIYTVVAFFCFFLVKSGLHSQSNKLLGAFFRQRILVYLGKISYGLYVFHILCINLVQKAGRAYELDNDLQFFLSLMLCIFISIASYEILEKPILRFKNTFSVVPSRKY